MLQSPLMFCTILDLLYKIRIRGFLIKKSLSLGGAFVSNFLSTIKSRIKLIIWWLVATSKKFV